MFDSEKSCLDAVEEMNGFELFGKVMKVSRAKTHSDETIKRKAPEMFDEHKRKRLTQKGSYDLVPPFVCCAADMSQTSSVRRRMRRRRPTPRRPQRSHARTSQELPP